MAVANTLAYYVTATITAVKSFTVQAPEVIQLFLKGLESITCLHRESLWHSGKAREIKQENQKDPVFVPQLGQTLKSEFSVTKIFSCS